LLDYLFTHMKIVVTRIAHMATKYIKFEILEQWYKRDSGNKLSCKKSKKHKFDNYIQKQFLEYWFKHFMCLPAVPVD